MKVEVRHLQRTCLQDKAFKKLVKRYGKLNHKLIICFDNRVKDCGFYWWDTNKKVHIIRISAKNNMSPYGNQLEAGAQKYNLISTLLHELRHAQQKEEQGVNFWSGKYFYSKDIENLEISNFYSICEIDARAFENKNLLSAIQLYDSSCINPKKVI